MKSPGAATALLKPCKSLLNIINTVVAKAEAAVQPSSASPMVFQAESYFCAVSIQPRLPTFDLKRDGKIAGFIPRQ